MIYVQSTKMPFSYERSVKYYRKNFLNVSLYASYLWNCFHLACTVNMNDFCVFHVMPKKPSGNWDPTVETCFKKYLSTWVVKWKFYLFFSGFSLLSENIFWASPNLKSFRRLCRDVLNNKRKLHILEFSQKCWLALT